MLDFNATSTSFTAILTNLSPSVMGLGGCVAFFVAIGLARGKDLLITLLVSLYVSTVITMLFPSYTWLEAQLGILNPMLLPLFILGLSTSVTALSLRRYIGSVYQQQTVWRLIEVIVLSIMLTGFACIALHHVVGSSLVPFFGPAQILFVPHGALTFWLAAPILSFPLFIRP